MTFRRSKQTPATARRSNVALQTEIARQSSFAAVQVLAERAERSGTITPADAASWDGLLESVRCLDQVLELVRPGTPARPTPPRRTVRAMASASVADGAADYLDHPDR